VARSDVKKTGGQLVVSVFVITGQWLVYVPCVLVIASHDDRSAYYGTDTVDLSNGNNHHHFAGGKHVTSFWKGVLKVLRFVPKSDRGRGGVSFTANSCDVIYGRTLLLSYA